MEQNLEELRKITVGEKKVFEHRIVKYAGKKFEIRQPTIRIRKQLREKCTVIENNAVKFDLFEFLVWCVIYCTYIPNTNERVFTNDDYNTLMDMPTGGFMDKFGEVASELVNIDTNTEKKS